MSFPDSFPPDRSELSAASVDCGAAGEPPADGNPSSPPQPVPTDQPGYPVGTMPDSRFSSGSDPPSERYPVENLEFVSDRGNSVTGSGAGSLLLPVGSGGEEVDLGPESVPLLALNNAPPWLCSMVLHMLLVIGAGLLVFPVIVERQLVLDITYEEKGDQLEEIFDEVAPITIEDFVKPTNTPQNLELVTEPLASPQEVELHQQANLSAAETSMPAVGLALKGREEGMKKALLTAYGGTPGTEAAVSRALEWFKRNQRPDGSWSLVGPYQNGGISENRLAATAMALLAFQGAGHTHLQGNYSNVVRKGWYALLGFQKEDGDFWQEGSGHHRLYSQAQATIAICELYGMTHDQQYRDPAQRAINYAIEIQDRAGGWRYRPRGGSDTSVTGWFVMALQSARMADLEVDPKALEKVSLYLDSAANLRGARYGYLPEAASDEVMTAEGLLCRQYLGWRRDDRRLKSGVEYLSVHPIDFQNRNVYYWYYATQVLHHMDDEHWDRWNDRMRVELPRHQEQGGREKGSWSPVGDRWGAQGGRLYTTALSTYMLEVYYRHLPIYAGAFDSS
ncbi:MAG: squalene--hopene cyclase [Planctomycetaceae bacterium]|nr:squalene--hopene cyclase [Planctomycetaceae bacterium]MBP61968.1 squalene--hopene cyclase [Planctomycetaceae bacterium]